MPAVTATIGINSLNTGVVSKVTTSRKVETKVITDFAGKFSAAAKYDPTGEFSVDGMGDYPSIALGVATLLIPTSISGGVIIIDSFKRTEKADDFQNWTYSGKHFPNAS